MTKIYLDTDMVWSNNRLPTEREAMRLIGYHVSAEINPEAAAALAAGIKTIVNGVCFEVVLNNEERECTTRIRG